ncbi:nitroreductase [Pectobacterium carotovorum]|uniref:nitroreductase n=1 Tax=Pectobacterium carotovorum TaxID=554 RepID=UPI0010FD16F6|nr:nitroreductase [Pectobacterium carotovorum]KAA3667354.1 nitroreductase [Pectobacterium carotovorum subsp. carotovorum]
MSENILTFDKAVRQRVSTRAFLPTPLTNEQLYEVLQDAQFSPSNCNTQPWKVHIVSGELKNKLTEQMIAKDQQGDVSPDFSFSYDDFFDGYYERSQEQARLYYESLGVSRDDKPTRKNLYLRNYKFFDAPHAAFLFMPTFGDNVRVASDIGMYAQNFLLSLTARGYAGIPQTMLGFHADLLRKELGVSSKYQLLFGISFGYADNEQKAANIRMPRLSVDESVTFHN